MARGRADNERFSLYVDRTLLRGISLPIYDGPRERLRGECHADRIGNEHHRLRDPGGGGYQGDWSTINTLPSFHRKIPGITDGTSNTIMVGTKAMNTGVYGNRGSGNVTLSNRTTVGSYDNPITMADIWADTGLGVCRAQDQDTVFWIAGAGVSPIPGTRFGMATSWGSWFPSTFQFVKDAPDIDAYNRWGSPYAGGSPTAMGDGSVRTFSYSTTSAVVIALCTPSGGEVIPANN